MNLLNNFWIIINLLKIFLIILPISFLGILIIKRITYDLKLAVLIPAGIIFGLALFTFITNLIFNFLPGKSGIWTSFLIIILSAAGLSRKIHWEKINLNKKILFFWLICFVSWSALIIWKANFALIGGDTRSYYAITGSFIKGNFPPITPWQPDTELAYHTGSFILLSALSYLTNIDYLPLHLILSAIFIICTIQILIWTILENFSVPKFLIANLAAAIAFISFGFVKVIYPVWPIELPRLENINELIIWLRNLPSARESIELYGVSYNLDSLIYIIFQNFGIAILFTLLVIILNFKHNFIHLTLLLIGLCTLALVNESIFVPVLIPIFIWSLFSLPPKIKSLQTIKVFLLFLFTGVFILFQGGLITASILSKDKTPSSIRLLPKDTGTTDYLINSQKSRLLDIKDNWNPFGWINVGIDVQLIISLILLLITKQERKSKIFCFLLIGFSTGAIAAYNLIIPNYVLSNSNRILVLAYQFLSIALVILIYNLTKSLKFTKIKLLTYTLLIIFIFLPTLLPPLAWISTTRFGPNKLLPMNKEKTLTDKWIENNTTHERIAVLDVNSPHPSGAASLMALTGSITPLFAGGFKTYTIEPGPEYTDIVYSLNPESLNKLKITRLIIDNKFYETLPQIRKNELENPNYFTLLFEEKDIRGWKKIYQIQSDYLLNEKNIYGSFEDLNRAAPKTGKFYIDSQQNFYIDYIRRPLIFTLKDRDLYFDAESGVYQHTETPVNMKAPVKNMQYDYLVLSDKTDPKNICNCRPKIIWKYLNEKIILWEIPSEK